MSRKTVLENSFLYTVSALLVKAIGFLLLPIYTLFLTTEDYGILNLVNSFTQVATFIIAFSLQVAVIRFYTDYKDDREKLKKFYGSVITFIALSGFIFVGICIVLRQFYIGLLFNGIAFFPYIVLALTTLIFTCLHTMHGRIMEGMQQGKKLTLINLVVFVLQASLNLILIGVFKLGAIGVLIGSLTINVAYVIYMIIDLKKNDLITFGIHITLLKDALKYSIPLMPHNLSTSIASFFSRIFINNSTTLSTVGLYSVAIQFGGLIDIIQSSVNRAFAPWFYNVMKNRNEKSIKDILNMSHLLMIMYSLMYMVIGLFSHEVIMIMTTQEYLMSWTLIPILVVAYSVKSIYYFYVNILFYHKAATKKIFFATITGSLLNIILAYVFVPILGMYGSAIAFLLAKIVVVVFVVIMSKGYDDIGYKLLDMLKIIAWSIIFMGGGLYFSYTKYMNEFNLLNLFYKLSIVTVYLVFVYKNNRHSIHEALSSNRIKKFIQKKRKAVN